MISTSQNKRSRRLFHGLLALLLTLCVTRYSLQINIPQGILLAIALLIALVGDQDEIIAMCVCCIPLHSSFEYAFAVLGGVVLYVVRFGSRIRFNRTIAPVCLMILWELMHCFGKPFSIVQFVGRCVPLLLIAVLMCSEERKFDYDFIVRAFVLSIAAMCISLIGKLLFVADFNLLRMISNLQRLGLDSDEAKQSLMVSGGEVNPNTLGIVCVLGIAGLMQLSTAGRRKKMDGLLLCVLLMFGVMTSSRTFLVCLAFAALLVLFAQRGSILRKVRFLIGLALTAALALGILYLIMPTLIEYYIGRFYESDLTTGRMDLMGAYHDFIISNAEILFFGAGLHDFGIKVLETYQVTTHVPHNGIQELIVAWGLPGLGLFAALFAAMTISSRRVCRRQGLIHYIPLLVVLLKVQAGQMLTSPYTMLAFSYAYLSMRAELMLETGRSSEPENMTEMNAVGVDFGRAVAALWRNGLVILAVSVGMAGAGFGIARCAMTPMYDSSVMFYVNNSSMAVREFAASVTSGDITVARQLVDPYIVILKARETLNRVAEHAGVELEYDALKGMLAASPVDETEIFKVTVSSDDPAEAEKIANAIAAVLPERVSEIIQGASARVVEGAVRASSPGSPNAVMCGIIGFIFGFVLIVLILLLKIIADTTIRSEADFVPVYDLPVLAAIPDVNKDQRFTNLSRR